MAGGWTGGRNVSDADRVLRLLANAGATQAEIAKACHIPVRSVQDIIQSLRLQGEPIVTNGDGVRLARTADEAMACAVALVVKTNGLV